MSEYRLSTSIQQVYTSSACSTRRYHKWSAASLAMHRHAQAVGKQLSVPEFPHTQAQLQKADHLAQSLWQDNIPGYSSGECALSQRNYSTIQPAYPPETWVIISISVASYFPTAQIRKAFCDLVKKLKDRNSDNVVTNYRYFKFEIFSFICQIHKKIYIFCNILKLKYFT